MSDKLNNQSAVSFGHITMTLHHQICDVTLMKNLGNVLAKSKLLHQTTLDYLKQPLGKGLDLYKLVCMECVINCHAKGI